MPPGYADILDQQGEPNPQLKAFWEVCVRDMGTDPSSKYDGEMDNWLRHAGLLFAGSAVWQSGDTKQASQLREILTEPDPARNTLSKVSLIAKVLGAAHTLFCTYAAAKTFVPDAADEETSPKVRSILGSFLFSDDTVDKKIGVLSGGERARVALCKLLLEPVNLLVMDEPTNHLDITSKELLKRALLEYDGSLIIISHDREFLQDLTEKVYEFKERNIKEYLGDINEFLKEKDLENFKRLETSQSKQKQKEQKKDSEHKISYQEKKELDKKIRKLSNRISKLEKEIDSLENEIKEIDKNLANPEKFKELSQNPDFFSKYEQKQEKLKDTEQNLYNQFL